MALNEAKDLLELIDMGRENPYNLRDCSTLTQIGQSILTVGGGVFDKYIDFIKAACVRVNLTSEEQVKYRYQPKQLSYDLYQTEELWFLLLRLNNLGSEIDFKPKKIWVLSPENLDLLNQILIINEEKIQSNHVEIQME